LEDIPEVPYISKDVVIIEERVVAATNGATLVEDIVIVVDPPTSQPPRAVTPLPTPVVVTTTPVPVQAPAPAPTATPTSVSTTADVRTVTYEEPRTATTPTVVIPNPERTPDAGNPGKIPSPMSERVGRDTKRFSSIIEPPLPWESKKDKKRARRHMKRAEHKKNILGETIYKGHPSWLLMRDIQTGLFQSIKTVSTNAVNTALNLFYTPPVQVFPIQEGSTSTFKFKDYCPGVFYKLREHFGINHQDYVASICHNWNEVGTPGKSGSLFFFSQDNQYVLKTIPKREAKLLRSLLPSYYHHIAKNNNSLLTRFMGLHRVKPHKGRQVRFLVMGNLFNGPLKIHQRFDLKGSTVGRELSAVQRQKKNPTFKDMDFRRLNKKIPLGPVMREQFLKQIAEDCKFLVSQNIMDYSLLIGIHFPSEEDEEAESSDDENVGDPSPMTRSAQNLPFIPEEVVNPLPKFTSIFETDEGGLRGRAEDGSLLDEYYYIGIIDILMLYSMRKQIEHAYKKTVSRGGEISSVKPDEYAARFLKFMSDITV
jgi:1-phosphatidylinositol-4-phosphate 5-kinase